MSRSAEKPARPRGHSLPIPPLRQCVIDLLHFARKIPSVPVQRRINIAALAAARRRAEPRPRWVTLFTKGYAAVCAEAAELRTAYLTFPWPRLYEHPECVASVAIEREHEGGRGVLFTQIRSPERAGVRDIDGRLTRCKEMPLDGFHSYRMARRLSWLPGPVRRLAWWVGLNVSGGRRAREFGTFGVSVYSGLGAESLHPISPLTSLLNYGPIDPDGGVTVRVVYDHRVMDGATVARALGRLEEVLNTVVAAELDGLAAGDGPASRAA